jgi:cellulose synthase/poly-beta-1,6-N-acetylglucosamine synthase-like glycosyltransferase
MSASAGVPPAVAVVVPTRDRIEHLRACLAALEQQTIGSYEVVVVDDGSWDAAGVAEVVATASHARLVVGAGRGPAAARNLGACASSAPVVAFVDDDCLAEPRWLAALVARLADGVASAVAGPTLTGEAGNPFAVASQVITNHLSASTLDAGTGALAFAPTCNLACRRDVAEDFPFDERFPMAAGEDREWCTRLVRAGGSLQYVPGAEVVHCQDLGWRTFWRQQVRYGRGARRYHRTAPAGRRRPSLRFYAELVRKGFAERPLVGGLVLVAQGATGVGWLLDATGR